MNTFTKSTAHAIQPAHQSDSLATPSGSDFEFQFEVEENAALAAGKQATAEKTSLSRKYDQTLDLYATRGVDDAFIQTARNLRKLALALGSGVGGHADAAAILSDLYMAWIDKEDKFDPDIGTELSWTQSVFSNGIRRQKSNLCIAGRGTIELDKPTLEGEAGAHESIPTATPADAQEAAPELALGGIMDLVQDGLSLPEIATKTQKHVRGVQRLFLKNTNQAAEIRVARMKCAGMTVEQIAEQILDRAPVQPSGEAAPKSYRAQCGLAPDLMAAAPSKKRRQAKPEKASKPKRTSITLDFIRDVPPQSNFDFGGAI